MPYDDGDEPTQEISARLAPKRAGSHGPNQLRSLFPQDEDPDDTIIQHGQHDDDPAESTQEIASTLSLPAGAVAAKRQPLKISTSILLGGVLFGLLASFLVLFLFRTTVPLDPKRQAGSQDKKLAAVTVGHASKPTVSGETRSVVSFDDNSNTQSSAPQQHVAPADASLAALPPAVESTAAGLPPVGLESAPISAPQHRAEALLAQDGTGMAPAGSLLKEEPLSSSSEAQLPEELIPQGNISIGEIPLPSTQFMMASTEPRSHTPQFLEPNPQELKRKNSVSLKFFPVQTEKGRFVNDASKVQWQGGFQLNDPAGNITLGETYQHYLGENLGLRSFSGLTAVENRQKQFLEKATELPSGIGTPRSYGK